MGRFSVFIDNSRLKDGTSVDARSPPDRGAVDGWIDATRFVPETGRWWLLLIAPFWLLVRGLWAALIAYILAFMVGKLLLSYLFISPSDYFGASEVGGMLPSSAPVSVIDANSESFILVWFIFCNWLVMTFSSDILRWRLIRAGFRECGTVWGRNLDEAESSYFSNSGHPGIQRMTGGSPVSAREQVETDAPVTADTVTAGNS